MMLLFTKNKLPLSKLIRWGLNEQASHFACAFMLSPSNGIVLHQKLNGFTVNWLNNFLYSNEVVFALRPKIKNYKLDKRIFLDIMQKFDGSDYDYKGLLYFAWRVLLLKFFKKPMPMNNVWGDNDEPICTSVAHIIQTHKPEWFFKDVKDFEIISPQGLYNVLKKSNHFEVKLIKGI